ncbi:MAG: DUF4405 domain-containing protein [Oscillospiraceae bacterium]
MKRNVIIKLFIDITMTVFYLLLMFAKGLGEFFHEAVGIGIGIIFIIHIIMNLSMIKGLSKAVKKGSPLRTILFASDILLMICMPVVIVTGILIARELFVIPSDISWELLFDVHNILSYVCLGIMALHLLLHAKYLIGVIKKLPSAFSGKEMKAAVGRFSAGAFAAVILYSSLALYKNISDKQEISDEHDKLAEKNTITYAPVSDSVTTESGTAKSSDISSQTVEAPSDDVEEEYNDKPAVTEQPEVEEMITQPETTSPPPPTLDEFLSELRCTGCGKNCLLTSPRCRKGQTQAEQATEEYYQIYG